MKAGIFFTMAGSWAVALRELGIPVAWHVCAREFRKPFALNFPDTFFYERALDIPVDLAAETDLIVGSPPCIGMSVGNRKFKGNKSEACPEHEANRITIDFARTVDAFQPKAFVMEMVPTFLGHRFDGLYAEYKSVLEPGYVVDEGIFDFSDYGVPQTRRRAIVMGVRRDLGVFPCFPDPTTPRDEQKTTVRQALAGLADMTEDEAVAQKLTRKFNPAWKGPYSHYIDTPDKYVLKWDQPAPTVAAINSSYWKHPGNHRLLTWREMARLQEFPDDFRFEGGFMKCVKLASWGVPCRGIQHFIAAAIAPVLGAE